MDFSFSAAERFAQSHGYALIFLVMMLEGPTITTAAAFAASLGYLNVWIILLLSIIADLIGDALHFWIGVAAGKPMIERYGKRFGLHKKTLKSLERKLQTNLGKTVFVIKMTPVAGIGILLAGALKVPFRRFLPYSVFITLPRAAFFTILGFSFGWAVHSVLAYFALGEYALLTLLFFVVIAYFLHRRMARQLNKKLSDEENASRASGAKRAKVRRS